MRTQSQEKQNLLKLKDIIYNKTYRKTIKDCENKINLTLIRLVFLRVAFSRGEGSIRPSLPISRTTNLISV